MATLLTLGPGASGYYACPIQRTNLLGSSVFMLEMTAYTDRPGSGSTSETKASVAGPTAGIEVGDTRSMAWTTPPLAAAVTISGNVTFNLYAFESGMNANAAINGILYKVDRISGAETLICKSANTVEVGTSSAASNFVVTPAAGVACNAGDRLRIIIYWDDAGTMGSGFTLTFRHWGASGADGDSTVTLTETVSFDHTTISSTAVSATDYPGTQLFLTDSAASGSINPGSATEKEMWTSRGAGSVSSTTNTVSGPTAGVQITATAGGTAIEWYTRPLQAVTIKNSCWFNLRGKVGTTAGSPSMLRSELAVTANDGTSPTVIGDMCGNNTGVCTTEADLQHVLGFDDTAISDGQRLRLRLLLDDVNQAMASGSTYVLTYAGTSAAAAGDSWVTFKQTLAESTGGGATDDVMPYVGGGLYPMTRRRSGLFVPDRWRDRIVVPRKPKLVLA